MSDVDRLAWRGVIDACIKCDGAGCLLYETSAGWRGGMQVPHRHRDVCDMCWGSGDRFRSFTDLRRLRDEEEARIADGVMQRAADLASIKWNGLNATHLAQCLRDLVVPAGRKRAALDGYAGQMVLAIASLIEKAAAAPRVGNVPALRPSEVSRSSRQMPEAERLLRAGFEIAKSFGTEGVAETALQKAIDAERSS